MRRKNKKYKGDETQTSVSENAESSELDSTANEENHDENNAEPEPKKKRKSTPSKKPHKEKKASKEEKENSDATAEEEEEEEEIQHEVEAVIDEKMIKGVKHFLIRWKGYSEDDDTWEPEDTLNCPDLVKQFHSSSRKNNSPKKPKESKIKKKKLKEKDAKDDEEESWDENEEFEVDRIIEVHHKRDGKREFLVSWKGYPPSQNSWVPEEDMTCTDMVTRFMSKVNRAKEVNSKDLRVKPAHTDRFTLSTTEPGRRLSKRNKGKQSVN